MRAEVGSSGYSRSLSEVDAGGRERLKNQYSGDINDYRKYGLLGVLMAHGRINACVCWMPTADDESIDRNLTASTSAAGYHIIVSV